MNNIIFRGALLLFAVVSLFCSSCNRSSSDSDSTTTVTTSTGDISFLASMTTRATETEFESGDAISVTAYSSDGSIYKQDVSYTYDGSLFSSLDPISLKSTGQTLSYRALYPYMELPSSGVVTFEVEQDQSSGDNYTLSDLMVSYASESGSTTPELIFDHYLSKINVDVTSLDITLSEVEVEVSLNLIAGVDYNILTLNYATNGDVTSITMANDALTSYKAIVAPQSVEAGATIGVVKVDDMSFDITTDQSRTFKAGREYSFDVTISDGAVTLTSGAINEWIDGDEEDGEDLSDTPATDDPLEGYYLSEFSGTSYPTPGEWVILDTEATDSDFEGLYDAMIAVGNESGTVSLSLPYIENIPASIFSATNKTAATALVSVSAPMVTLAEAYLFNGYTSLSSIYMPNVTILSSFTFGNCSSLTELEIASEEGVVIEQIVSYALNSVTLSNITLTIGEENESMVNGDTLTAISAGTATKEWGPFKEIIIKRY